MAIKSWRFEVLKDLEVDSIQNDQGRKGSVSLFWVIMWAIILYLGTQRVISKQCLYFSIINYVGLKIEIISVIIIPSKMLHLILCMTFKRRLRDCAVFPVPDIPWKRYVMKSMAVPKLELGNPNKATRQMASTMWCLLRYLLRYFFLNNRSLPWQRSKQRQASHFYPMTVVFVSWWLLLADLINSISLLKTVSNWLFVSNWLWTKSNPVNRF